MKICVYAFSTSVLFFRDFIAACDLAGDDVEWSAIVPQGHFRHEIRTVLPLDRICYLYEGFSARHACIGPAEIQHAQESGEGLFASLMKDKDGYRKLPKEDQLKRAATIHACYEEFLRRVQPDYVLFPDLEVVDGFILLNLCRSLGIKVIYFTGMRFLGASFFAMDSTEALPPYFGRYDEQNLLAARTVIERFRSRHGLAAGANYASCPPPKLGLFSRIVFNTYLFWRYERLHATEDDIVLKIKRNLIGLTNGFRRMRFNALAKRFFDAVAFEKLPNKYVFYALHYIPESSINGLEPYFVDQLRAVDALLLNMPRGHWLVVKEHPAMYGVRSFDFYRELCRRPGLILLHPSMDSRRLVEGAALVVTITGTIGLEAYLLGKPCLSFGRNFFAHLCQPAPALSALRETMERLIASYVPASEAEKEIAIAKLLNIGADFIISDPWFSPSVLAPENIATAREHLWKHLDCLSKVQNPPAASV